MSAPPPAAIPELNLGISSTKDTGAVTVPYDPAKDREKLRGIIALTMISLLGLIICASLLLLWIHPDRSKEVQDWLTLIFSPIIALVGSAIGFYFGTRDTPAGDR